MFGARSRFEMRQVAARLVSTRRLATVCQRRPALSTALAVYGHDGRIDFTPTRHQSQVSGFNTDDQCWTFTQPAAREHSSSPDYAAMRASGTLMVDKTGSIADLLIHSLPSYQRVFFARPRKFGKSFTLSVAAKMLAAGSLPPGVTPWPAYESVDIEALFGGTEVHRRLLEEPAGLHGLLQQAHFVIHLDLSGAQSGVELGDLIKRQLARIGGVAFASEALQAKIMRAPTEGAALSSLVEAVPKGVPVALLVDEYAQAIVSDVGKQRWDAAEKGVSALCSLMMIAKHAGTGGRIKRWLMAGAARLGFAQASFLRGANNFEDLTADPLLSRVLGFTGEEIAAIFPDHLRRLAESSAGATDDPAGAALDELQKWHGGLCFDGKTSTFAPFPVLTALDAGKITTTEATPLDLPVGLLPASMFQAFSTTTDGLPLSAADDIAQAQGSMIGRIHPVSMLLQLGLLSLVPGNPRLCRPPNEYARRSLQEMAAAALQAERDASK